MTFDTKAFVLRRLSAVGPQWLPFADVASEEVPLRRLLRLSLFQITVGMALVLMMGTLNRVMIVELQVPATLVAGMLALPILFAPFRALIGFRSDAHVSALGLRRVPYIWKGTLYQFGGFAIMPFALLVLSGYGEAVDAPRWIGLSAAALSFLLVGAGLHMVQTVGLALATDLVDEEDQPRVVGLMYVMLLAGMVGAALVFGTLLDPYTPGRLVQVIQGAAVVTMALNLFAMWKQEARDRVRARAMETAPRPRFADAWARLSATSGTHRLLVIIGLGTLGFGMADVLLEPYGAHALGLSVSGTTRLTALLALGTLCGFGIASRVLRGPLPANALARLGAAIGLPGFAAVILSSMGGGLAMFLIGTFMTGLGAGLFGHATLTAAIRNAPRGQTGLALGAWGAVQATSAGVGIVLAGLVRDTLVLSPAISGHDPVLPYNTVFGVEMLCLGAVILLMLPARAKPRGNRTVDRGRALPERTNQNSVEVS